MGQKKPASRARPRKNVKRPELCARHREYTARNRPNVDCETCWVAWEERHPGQPRDNRVCPDCGGAKATKSVRCGTCAANARRVGGDESLDPAEQIKRDVTLTSVRATADRYRRLYQERIRQDAEEERLIEMFRSSIDALPDLGREVLAARPRARHGSRTVETPVLLLGDLHVGEQISETETHGINRYDFQVFQDRLEYLEDRVLDILFQHQSSEYPELVVVGLGDNVSGRIHEELQKYGAQHVVDQVVMGATVTAVFLYRLAQHFPRLRYVGVSGNHGRLGKEKEAKRYYKNFDYLWNAQLAVLLRNVRQIEVKIPRAIFTVEDVAAHRILISHGMELPPSSLGIPLYSVNRASSQYQELLAFAKEGRYDYWCLGHFHRPLELDNCIVNGCMSGLSEFGIGKAAKPIRPMQKLIGFHERHGKAWEYPIRLDQAPEAKLYRFAPDLTIGEALDRYEELTSGGER